MTTVSEAAGTNVRRDVLIALRDKIANSIDDCKSGRDMAALSKRLMEVMAEIEKCPDPNAQPSKLNQLRKKAAKRQSAKDVAGEASSL